MAESTVTATPAEAGTVTCRRRHAEVLEFRARGEYAVFYIDDRRERAPGRSGYYTLAIESSFGGFAYAWGDPGRDFRGFLAQLNLDYVRSKMVGFDVAFDGEATTRAVKEALVELRRAQGCDRETAREAWPESEIENECDFGRWLDALPARLYDQLSAWELGRQGPGRRAHEFTALYEQFWPLLSAELTAEAA